MAPGREVVSGGVLAQLTLPELIELWVETEIDRRLGEVDCYSESIVDGARGMGTLQVLPERGGFHDNACSIEVLVEVRDQRLRRTRIGAWQEKKRGQRDDHAFDRAYEKATAHAIIQLLPATVWRRWIGTPTA